MIPVTSYRGIEEMETLIFKHDNPPPPFVRLIGLVFCRPESALTKADIVPSLTYYHYRSGRHTAFYFGGYQISRLSIPQHSRAYTKIEGPERKIWYFSPESFNDFREEIEKRTKWRYSGGCDLILTNSKFDRRRKRARLDFSTAILLKLDKIHEISRIATVPNLINSTAASCGV